MRLLLTQSHERSLLVRVMKKTWVLTEHLWGSKARFRYLFGSAVLLLFTFLGSREIWTQEHRWAEIVAGMFYRHDFLHPYLGNTAYYDKPLLSYWLIAFFAHLSHSLNTWTLRLPSALAGLLAIVSIYQLGVRLKDKQLGLLAGWLLLTTYYFVFWSRTSSADMLNLAGSLFAIAWYFIKRDDARFMDYAIFFLVLALTSLCKGLVGAMVPLIAVAVDVLLQQSFKKHLRPIVLLALLPGLFVYFLPFVASSCLGGHTFTENGLYLVYRENVLRYFQPFDHELPFYVYFIYLPIYLLPWSIFCVQALLTLPSRYKTMSLNAKWVVWTSLALFLFFTFSGSRRGYYILPVVPLMILFIADGLLATHTVSMVKRWPVCLVVFCFIALFVLLDLGPAWYYREFGVSGFVAHLKKAATERKPWNEWDLITLDAESKMNFYLDRPPGAMNYHIKGNVRDHLPTAAQLLVAWPVLSDKSGKVIFISRAMYLPLLKNILTNYQLIETHYPALPFFKQYDKNAPIAFLPKGPLSAEKD